MNKEPVQIDPILSIVARIVERDDVRRASLLIEVEKAEQEGRKIDHSSGFDWHKFWIHFASQNPRLILFMPIAIVLYLMIFYQWIFG